MLFSSNDFKDVYSQNKVLVYNVALNYLQNIEDAEEITQDVFIKVHQSLHKFENNATLKTWIYRITINCCLDYIKHKNSKKRFFIFGTKSDAETELQKVSHFDHPGIVLENKENAEILFKVINELTENQKTAFMLSKLDGLSNSEIATIMEVSISSVESLVFRAKAALKEKLSQKFETYRKKK
jgi:RNA polymerase sigma factor (sigma-70 family)